MGNIIAAIAVLGALGALFGLILSVASKIFEVKKDPREEAILSHLAGANCGGCGYPGCAGCAAGGGGCCQPFGQVSIPRFSVKSDLTNWNPLCFSPLPLQERAARPPGRRVLAISAILWYHTLRSPFRTGGVP